MIEDQRINGCSCRQSVDSVRLIHVFAGKEMFRVRCFACGAGTPEIDNREQAIRVWNLLVLASAPYVRPEAATSHIITDEVKS